MLKHFFVFSLLVISNQAFAQLSGYTFQDTQHGVHIYYKQDPDNGVVYVKYKNDWVDLKIKGIITIKWYEPNGSYCGKSSQAFLARPGVSGGRSEGDFFVAPSSCKAAKTAVNFRIELSEIE